MRRLRQSVLGNLRCRVHAGILVDLLQKDRGLLSGLVLRHVGLDFESLALG